MAGARPNNRPQTKESAAVTPSTFQFNSACSVKFCCPLESRSVSDRTPHMANKTPNAPPSDASSTLSVSNCRTTRNRHCPRAEPDSYFAASRGGPCQQQSGDVRARDRQDQSHHRQEYVQRLRILSAQGDPNRGGGT